ncbi:membrane protein [Kordiimonas sediminis]|uniref:Membrane protein n=1 Tax=Kordiimonas sediminis TaxID=1735581 RepID=A0A919EA04_9PROT|nr:DUF924 family protein [Kordiimonas sediminis]GHF27262.1 membrane protein [Kordiimonas sediminis]
MRYTDILTFWFHELTPQDWWTKSKDLDAHITRRFQTIYTLAAKGECGHWRSSIKGRLAEILVLDQFPRNMFRDSAKAFETDIAALILAQEAVKDQNYGLLSPNEKIFLQMPFMHSESKAIHEEAVRLFSQPGMETNLDYEYRHKAIIDRFGRYPHRNALLGRKSTPDEIEFLKAPGSSF